MKKTILLLLLGVSLGTQAQQKTEVSERNKEMTRKILQAFDNGDTDALDKLIVENPVEHGEMPPDIKSKGLEAVKEMCRMQKTAFPDIKTNIHVMATAGDTVIAFYTSEGTNTGPFMGMPATNKSFRIEGVDIIRFENGRAVEHWGVYDNLKMMQQLGMMPPAPPSVRNKKQ